MRRAALVLLLTVVAAGCRTSRVEMPIAVPALEVPPAPARLVEPPPPPERTGFDVEPAPTLPPESGKGVVERQKQQRSAQPRDPATKEQQKTEAKPDTAPDTQQAPDPSEPVQPAPLLRTPATARDTAAAERQINETLERAENGLRLVNYDGLSEARKKWFKEAEDFIRSARAAVKASDFELGKELADKADKYAKELQGR